MFVIRKLIPVVLVSFLSCNEAGNDNSPATIEKGRPFDKIRLTDLYDQLINLEKYNGKIVFINFWATWCKPCIDEMPTIERAQSILNNKDIIFLIASSESSEEIDFFKKAHKFNFNYVQIQNSEELNVQALPTTFIFNRNGKQVFSESGYRKWDEENNINLIRSIISKSE